MHVNKYLEKVSNINMVSTPNKNNMKKIILISLIALIGLSVSAQCYKYRIDSKKFKVGNIKIDTCYVCINTVTQFRKDTISRIDVNLYNDSTDMVNMQNVVISFTASWRGYATLAKQGDSCVAVLSRKFGINKNKFIVQ